MTDSVMVDERTLDQLLSLDQNKHDEAVSTIQEQLALGRIVSFPGNTVKLEGSISESGIMGAAYMWINSVDLKDKFETSCDLKPEFISDYFAADKYTQLKMEAVILDWITEGKRVYFPDRVRTIDPRCKHGGNVNQCLVEWQREQQTSLLSS